MEIMAHLCYILDVNCSLETQLYFYLCNIWPKCFSDLQKLLHDSSIIIQIVDNLKEKQRKVS